MSGLSSNMRGAVFMMASMLFFTINDTCMKLLSDELPLFQSIALRGFGSSVVLVLILLATRQRVSVPLARDRWLILVRTVFEAVGAFTFIGALYHLPISDTTAILQATPLAVTLAGALFLGEKVGWRRLSAILVGFAGVMLIIQPGGDGFSRYAFLPIACVFAVVIRDLATRRLSHEVPSLVVAAATGIGVTIASGLLSLSEDWAPIDLRATGLLGGAVVFVLLGYLTSIKTMRIGEVAFVAPFRYTGLVIALVVGFVVFGEIPDFWMLVGSALVVATGLFTFWRERRLAGR
jgi:drug/metabolite transporter (DMT)-like permease